MPDQNWLVVNGLVCPVSFNSKKKKNNWLPFLASAQGIPMRLLYSLQPLRRLDSSLEAFGSTKSQIWP